MYNSSATDMFRLGKEDLYIDPYLHNFLYSSDTMEDMVDPSVIIFKDFRHVHRYVCMR